ncbi:hypothetical protein HPB47_025688 [Ixodes persulcatus]|uniref:Uncharacterized protein n=1 Tax=Ixodes persulcatus TaxID=34615 RepID=A0AC60Q104_IXOPE|nr:hypothetical protein HPB47_025688 [Ixodes persulcatus]
MAAKVFLMLALAASGVCGVIRCPKSQTQLYPCKCTHSEHSGLHVLCENVNLAMMSRGLGKVDQPIANLTISKASFKNLFGDVFKGLHVINLTVTHGSLSSVALDVMDHFNESLTSLSFENNTFEEIPVELINKFRNLTSLNLAHNRIEVIPANAFGALNILLQLRLDHNRVFKIHPAAFTGLNRLDRLELHHNRLEKFERNTFRVVRKVKYLDLSYNNFTTLQRTDFNQLTNMWFLNISNNKIKTFPRSMFVANAILRVINMSYNELPEVDANTVKGVRFLRDVYFRGNKIKSVHKQAFISAKHLRTLDLAYNLLEDIGYEQFKDFQWLERLDLSYNKISKIASSGFLKMYQTLSLGHNNIENIPWEALQDMSSLQYLYLHNNKITKLPKKAFGRLPVVFDLRLQHNQINNISEYAFEGMLQLLRLNLSFNNLSLIPPEAFKGLVSLHSLDLSHNKLNKLENKTHGLLDDLLSLETVNVSHNEVAFVTDKTFPKSPYIPYKLKRVNLSHNFLSVLTNSFDDGLGKVELLDLKHNLINEIYPNVLKNLSSLQFLDMSHNDLRHDLEHLDLRFNNVSRFEEEFVSRIKKGLRLFYEGNPLNCDCHVKYLRQWLSNSPQAIEWNAVRCTGPQQLQNRLFMDVTPDALHCRSEEEAKLDDEDDGAPVDLKFRLVDSPSSNKIRFAWYVSTQEDVSGFRAVVSDVPTSSLAAEKDIPYRSREYSIDGLEAAVEYRLCLIALDSTGGTRTFTSSQCRTVTPVGDGGRVTFAVPLVALSVVLVLWNSFRI